MYEKKPFREILKETLKAQRKKRFPNAEEFAHESERISANDVYLKFKKNFHEDIIEQKAGISKYLEHSHEY